MFSWDEHGNLQVADVEKLNNWLSKYEVSHYSKLNEDILIARLYDLFSENNKQIFNKMTLVYRKYFLQKDNNVFKNFLRRIIEIKKDRTNLELEEIVTCLLYYEYNVKTGTK